MAPRLPPLILVLRAAVLAAFCLFVSTNTPAQTNSANLSGIIVDENGSLVPATAITVLNDSTSLKRETTTNDTGHFSVPVLPPGTYRLTAVRTGFKTVEVRGIELNVNDERSLRIQMKVGQITEKVDVTDEVPLINDSPAVSTVVDQQFVESLPLNGRSFQSLISLAPGVVITRVSGVESPGQFSVNGQRVNTNYFMVDGVSANFAAANFSTLAATIGGNTPALTTAGGTNGLVSVDAMREFSIQTSSYSTEFGRSPGAQISIVTRSGTNEFHGTAFDYWRNDVLDARNWFNQKPASKPPLRQNDFGGTLGGPIVRNRSFFFFSYEGLQLRQPKTVSSFFYTEAARQNVAAAWKPIMAAYSSGSGTVTANGRLQLIDGSWSDRNTLNATSLRVDHNLSDRLSLFGRFNHSPSSATRRVFSFLSESDNIIDTLTLGLVFAIDSNRINDLRVNWSRAIGKTISRTDEFMGAVIPAESDLFPPGYDHTNAQAVYTFTELPLSFRYGVFNDNSQTQFTVVDTFLTTVGKHQLRFGFDWRRLKPDAAFAPLSTGSSGTTYANLQAGIAPTVVALAGNNNGARIDNLSFFAQDVWRKSSRLTVTYGLRWESNGPPVSVTDRPIYAFQGVFDQKQIGFAPAGTPLWRREWNKFAPRVGAAYQLASNAVLRGGFGLFYDIGMPWSVGGLLATTFPYARGKITTNVPFDLSNPAFLPPPFSLTPTNRTTSAAIDPNLTLPATWQWNAAVERQLSSTQSLSISYVGSKGYDLPQTIFLGKPGDPLYSAILATYNVGWSNYNSLQFAYERRLSRGLQALVQYTLAKSVDTASVDRNAGVIVTNLYTTDLNAVNVGQLEGPSDYDVRHNFSAGFSYIVPSLKWGKFAGAVLNGWTLDGIVRLRSAFPLTPTTNVFEPDSISHRVPLDRVPGQPVWIDDTFNPGLKQLNPAAFSLPADGYGDVPRNSIRGVSRLNQTDLGLTRKFNLTEKVKLTVRVEYFNIFNHPMFMEDDGTTFWGINSTPLPSFGKISQTLNNALGGLSPIYQIGGPRSGQVSLRLNF